MARKKKAAPEPDSNVISTGGFLTASGSPKQQEIAKIATDLGEMYDIKVSVRHVQLVQAASRRVTGRVKNLGLKNKAEA